MRRPSPQKARAVSAPAEDRSMIAFQYLVAFVAAACAVLLPSLT